MSVVLLGSTSGSVTLQEPAVAGSTVIDLPATSGTMAVLPTATSVLPEASGGTGTTTGYYGFKNRIINGAMAIWQRGTSLTGLTPSLGVTAYTADRWFVNQLGFQSATDVAQQTGGATKYSARIQKRAGSSGASINQFGQVIENLNCLDLPNKTLTLSFTAKAGANYSATSNLLNVYIYTCTAADQSSGAFVNGTATGQATLYSGTVTLTTSNQAFSITTSAVGATVTNVCVLFSETSSASAAGANDWYEISDVQLEKGSTATSFDYRPYGTELALCQRYFEILPAGGSGIYGSTANLGYVNWQYKVTKRASPTVTLGVGSVITAFDYTNEWGCSGYRNGYPVIGPSTSASAEL